MLHVSGSNGRLPSHAFAQPTLACVAAGDAPFMLALRVVAHLPYFKVASMLMLPQGLSTAGVVVTTLAYSLACLVASRWSAGLRRTAVAPSHPVVLPLLAATAVLITMLVICPAIAMLLPRYPGQAVDLVDVLPPCLALLAPVCALFLAAQALSVRLLRTA